MNLDNTKPLANSPQIIPFPVEKPPSQVLINTDDDKDIFLLYSYYHYMVYRRCLEILHDEEKAKDMASAVFEKLQVLKTKKQFNYKKFPKTYIYRMAENMSKNELKRISRERKKLIKFFDNTISEKMNDEINSGEQKQWELNIIGNGYEKEKAEKIIKAILNEQDETTRKIYFYKYHEDMTLEQIGEAVGLKKSAVQKRIKKFEKQVKAVIERDVK